MMSNTKYKTTGMKGKINGWNFEQIRDLETGFVVYNLEKKGVRHEYVTPQKMHEIVVKIRCECVRCGVNWSKRTEEPKYCPHCKSPYWNKVYVRKGGRNKEKQEEK